MKAKPALFTIDHIFFAYLSPQRRAEIAARIERGVSHLVSFHDEGGELVFMAVIDTDNAEHLHLAECAGKFPRHYRYLDQFMTALAKVSGKAAVSFYSGIDGVKYLAKKAGYTLDRDADFVKAIA